MRGEREKAAVFKFHSDGDAAPPAIDKGQGLAEKIIALARKNGVPVREDRHLIEILSTIDLYEEVPAELYKAVAEILSFIHTMSKRA